MFYFAPSMEQTDFHICQSEFLVGDIHLSFYKHRQRDRVAVKIFPPLAQFFFLLLCFFDLSEQINKFTMRPMQMNNWDSPESEIKEKKTALLIIPKNVPELPIMTRNLVYRAHLNYQAIPICTYKIKWTAIADRKSSKFYPQVISHFSRSIMHLFYVEIHSIFHKQSVFL